MFYTFSDALQKKDADFHFGKICVFCVSELEPTFVPVRIFIQPVFPHSRTEVGKMYVILRAVERAAPTEAVFVEGLDHNAI